MFTSMHDLTFLHSLTLAFGLPSGGEWSILLVLGLLIFGRRLPEVGRSLGRGIVEFKKGIRGIEEDIDEESSKSGPHYGDSPRQELPRPRPPEERVEERNPYATVEQRPRNE